MLRRVVRVELEVFVSVCGFPVDTGFKKKKTVHSGLKKIGGNLQFDGASEEREEAIEGDKYRDESGTDPDSDLSDDDLTRQNL